MVSFAAGFSVPQSSTEPRPLQWKPRMLTTMPPGNSLNIVFCAYCYTIRQWEIHQSVKFSCSVVSDSLRPYGLQHARPPCPSPTPRVYSNSCPLSQWCHPTISSCHPLLLQPSIFPSIRVFSNEPVLLIRWPKYWNFSFSISPANEYSGLTSSRTDWLDLLAVQRTLILLQYHSLKASILGRSAFFIVQLSYPYMTTGKKIALTI